jgi:type II secretory pathway component GspD/PulD (secretin)
LKHCDNSKAIKEIQKNKKQDLEFTYDETNGKIVVHQVPAVYGVRCKSTIQGYQTPGTTSIKPVLWPKSKKKDAKCTLMELMRENKINKQTDTLVFHMPVTYCTHCVKVDSKE